MKSPSSRRAASGAYKIGRVALSSLVPTLGALLLSTGLSGDRAEAKTPGKTYCFYSKCHRVKTIKETEALVGSEETLMASHYDSCKRDRYNPCGLTSSGAPFDSEAPDNAASPIYPDGTALLVWSPATKVSLVLRVNNAGPYWGDRRLDVSRKAAEKLGFAGQGVAKLKVRVIDAPSLEEATYKKNRSYDPVPGYIGEFASLDEAQAGAERAYMVAGLPSPFPAVLGGGNPTVVAGSLGTQSGAAMIVPTVLAAAEPSESSTAVAAQPALQPIKVAALVSTVAVQDVPATEPQAVRQIEKKAASKPAAKSRSHAERTAPRNSRSYRVAAAKQKQRLAARGKPVMTASARESGKRFVTQDGTNDMSVFTRHPHAGMERLAPQESARRRYYSSATRFAARDRRDG
ncbi:septal ring lytic transglycosylase RlpA family protein [Hyphomicrobium sp.]|uniref:septal ring lytic transglycosylase RlpA family protein n=1 Tax=Hyphomicrobium sp. TaxID=82 RepID=UPI002E361264|nr:RlpA-like double-psi beta-barrel domain-containing protein [Hyphomicrobium sp.]HEX2842646.1 RlpA-like double-psi beta-barrel domain-containing protein [Hyphomicrobium sp.]